MDTTIKPLSNIEIDHIMKKYKIKNFRGVSSKDMLPKTMLKSECGVVNVQDYFAGPGTHWVCYYCDLHSNDVEYFDSFGLYPPSEILSYLKTAKKGIVYNRSQIQNINSVMCGYYCCYYLIKRYYNNKPLDILLDYEQKPTTFNERLIKQFANFIK
ncbi:TPA_asm: adenain [Trichoplax MELD virus]|nr:TPA_asm: adenain [Trichoplax MELD virus]